MIGTRCRREAIELIDEAVVAGARIAKACEIVGITDRTYRTWKNAGRLEDRRTTCERPTPARALSQEEREAVLKRFCEPDVCDMTPERAVPQLLDQGEYLASASTVRRLLKKADLMTKRNGMRTARPRKGPTSYRATGPNQVWTWDITYFKDARYSGRFFYGYVIVDVFSRYMIAAEVYPADNAEFAREFLRKAFEKHCIHPRQLVLHSDNGASMKAAGTLALLKERGITFSHNRPRVSNDNPYSESLFKTLKYMGRYPGGGFGSIEHCRQWLNDFAIRYNGEHLHSGINYVTPKSRHEGEDVEILRRRKETLEQARAKHPERWIQGKTLNCEPAGEQWLNPE